MDQNKMSNNYREPSIDASNQVYVHLAKQFQRKEKFFQKLANQKQELPMTAMFVNGSGRNEYSLEDLPQMLPTKFQFIWASGFRGEDFQKSTNQKHKLPKAALFVNGSGRNEHSLPRTFHRCFLPSSSSFGKVVSEKKIKM